MIKKIVAFSLCHPLSLLSFVIALVLLGLFSLVYITVNFLPTVSNRTIIISTYFTGLGVEDMENLVTKVIEEDVSSLQGVKSYESVTLDGHSLIKLQLHWGG